MAALADGAVDELEAGELQPSDAGGSPDQRPGRAALDQRNLNASPRPDQKPKAPLHSRGREPLAVHEGSPCQPSRAGPVSSIRLKPRRTGNSAHSDSPSHHSPPSRTCSPRLSRLPSTPRGKLDRPSRDSHRDRDRDSAGGRGRDGFRDRDREPGRAADAARLPGHDRRAPPSASSHPSSTGRDSRPAASPRDQLGPSGRSTTPSQHRPRSPEAARRADRGQHRLAHSTATPDLRSAARHSSSPRHQPPHSTGHADRPSQASPAHLHSSRRPHSSPQPSRPRDQSHADRPGAHRPHSARGRARSPRRPDSPAAWQQSRGRASGPSCHGRGPDSHRQDLHSGGPAAVRSHGPQPARDLQAQERPRQPEAERHRPRARRPAPVDSGAADGGAGSPAEHRLGGSGGSGSGAQLPPPPPLKLPQPPRHTHPPPGPPPRSAPYDPALDFLSEHFDAAKALATPGLQPPVPGAPMLDNLSKCQPLVPGFVPKAKAPADQEKRRKALELSERLRLARKAAAEAVKQNVFQGMAAPFSQGPLAMLKACREREGCVRVATRHPRGLRGVATGKLVAFDRHLNLLLSDVHETYVVRLRVQRSKDVQKMVPVDEEASASSLPGGQDKPEAITDMLYGQSAADPTADVRWDASDQPAPTAPAAASAVPSQVRAADGLDFREGTDAAADGLTDGDMPPFMQLLRSSDPAPAVQQAGGVMADAPAQQQALQGPVPHSLGSPQAGEEAGPANRLQAQESDLPEHVSAMQGLDTAMQPVDVAIAAEGRQQGSGPQDLSSGRLEMRTVTQTRQGFKQEHRVRQLKSLFLRGSCVVLVNPVQDAAQHRLSYKPPHRRHNDKP